MTRVTVSELSHILEEHMRRKVKGETPQDQKLLLEPSCEAACERMQTALFTLGAAWSNDVKDRHSVQHVAAELLVLSTTVTPTRRVPRVVIRYAQTNSLLATYSEYYSTTHITDILIDRSVCNVQNGGTL